MLSTWNFLSMPDYAYDENACSNNKRPATYSRKRIA